MYLHVHFHRVMRIRQYTEYLIDVPKSRLDDHPRLVLEPVEGGHDWDAVLSCTWPDTDGIKYICCRCGREVNERELWRMSPIEVKAREEELCEPLKVNAHPALCADYLQKAAEYIERHGWAQKTNEDPLTGKVCLLGALNAVTAGSPWTPIHHELLGGLLGYLGLKAPAKWNDSPKRTKEQVISRLYEGARAAKRDARRNV